MRAWMPIVILYWILIMLASGCGGAESKTLDPEALNPTFVQTVVVVERSGEFYAEVEGWLPDACSSLAGAEQQVDKKTIYLTVYSTRPKDLDCAQMLVDFSEEIRLETNGLQPGTYRLVANEDQAETTFQIP
jgi:hypothetical protein